MTLPHQCRCFICGEIGTITPGLPNVFANLLEGKVDVPPEDIERRAVVQKGDPGPHPLETRGTSGDSAYASSRADELAPREPPPAYANVPTCVHGYTRCMPCKFPAA
jgi:hypothetical protein